MNREMGRVYPRADAPPAAGYRFVAAGARPCRVQCDHKLLAGGLTHRTRFKFRRQNADTGT